MSGTSRDKSRDKLGTFGTQPMSRFGTGRDSPSLEGRPCPETGRHVRPNIGGSLDYLKLTTAQPSAPGAESGSEIPVQHRPPSAAYDLLIDKARIANRPTGLDGLRQAALDLRRSGLRTADIARALDMSSGAVEQLLQEREP